MLYPGDIVEFSIEKGEDGRRKAVDVTCLKGTMIHVAGSTGRGGGPPRDRSKRGSGASCYNCGQAGHFARDCRQCFEGRWVGGGGLGVVCYNCGQLGHLARDCSQSSGPSRQAFRGSCYNCGQSGHMARDCNRESGSLVNISIRGYTGGGRVCCNCGEQSHIATDCPNIDDS